MRKAAEHYIPEILFIMLKKMVVSLKSVDKI